MPTRDEISSGYAEKIKSAIKTSGLTKSASIINESTKRVKVISVFKEISNDIKTYTIDNKPLSETEKENIFKKVGNILGLSKPEKIYLMIKEGSNDEFVSLANYWAQFFEEIKL